MQPYPEKEQSHLQIPSQRATSPLPLPAPWQAFLDTGSIKDLESTLPQRTIPAKASGHLLRPKFPDSEALVEHMIWGEAF